MSDVTLAQLKGLGLSVAVHNDYRLKGESFTFWLFTAPDGMSYKGEGRTDEEAWQEVKQALDDENEVQSILADINKEGYYLALFVREHNFFYTAYSNEHMRTAPARSSKLEALKEMQRILQA